MAITVNIPGTATAELDERSYITISLQVQIMDGATILGDKIITISVYQHTANVLNYAVSMMIDQITQFKNLCVKQTNMRVALLNFTNQVKAGV